MFLVSRISPSELSASHLRSKENCLSLPLATFEGSGKTGMISLVALFSTQWLGAGGFTRSELGRPAFCPPRTPRKDDRELNPGGGRPRILRECKLHPGFPVQGVKYQAFS